MQITIRDRQLKKLTAINNDIPEMLSFQDETLHLYKENSTATFDFSIPKYYFGKLHKDVDFINDDIYISLIDDGRPYYFYVHTLVQDDFRFTLTCNDANLEYTMEQANPFINTEAHNINWYLEQMGLLDFAGVYVGLNEISDITRTLSFDNQQTKLERLSSLINQFGGEFELVTEVDKNGKYKGIRLDIYHEADNTHHGMGKVRGDVTLKYGKEVTGVQVTSVKEGFFNAGIFTGENGLDISDVEKTVKDEDGNVLFYTHAGSQMVYAPQSRDKYPSNVLSSDRWTRRDFSTNYTNKNELVNYTFKTIEQLSKPQITFLVSARSDMLNGIKDLSIGDTVFIFDKNFKNGLLLKARVSEIIKCFTQPNNSAYVFTNYEVIKNNISSTLRSRIDEILESKIPYDLRILTNNGLQFKNSNGTSIISPELWKNNKKLNATFRFKNRDVVLGSGLQYTADPKQFIDILNLTIEAYIGNDLVATRQITFTNVSDGPKGDKGEKGALDEEQVKEITDKIDTKADSKLTQDQLNLLLETQNLMTAELKAKATAEQADSLLATVNKILSDNAIIGADTEAKLIANAERIEAFRKDYDNKMLQLDFVSNYMRATDLGLEVSASDGSSSLLIQKDRISMFSAGKEVMYISQGLIHIDNGVFTKTIQIGNFRESQLDGDPTTNVTIYVG
ncbi:hypothetical protein [Streptococcus parauberis]|uniref:hypothetical protein n=1 Tax=Streptococcus parauberis TaxID=1348 RepID=UPI0039AF7861